MFMDLPDDQKLLTLASATGEKLKALGLMLSTAESCTGGWVAKVITDVPGSSQWFDRGFVTYTNLSKEEMLGVSALTLAENGAVSEVTVLEMVSGAMRRSQANVGLAISGIAGPGGATVYKPVGTVCFAWSVKGHSWSQTIHFDGDRSAVRGQAVHFALEQLNLYLHEQS